MLKKHLSVLALIAEKLESKNIPYQVTGGIAGNIHGSLQPPQDIDLEVAAADFGRVAELFADEMKQPPHHLVDDEFDLWLMTLSIDGIEIDINQVEDAFAITKDGCRVPFSTNLSRSERRQISGIEVMVQPLEDLIAYKSLIGREADIVDLSSLFQQKL
ncbi:MAG: nucleotidyltransferase [Candidatus Obscuribacterales bacterium]|nr:nucleotidyltransferase [Candidatus Obscuribacterales bacterium]